MRLRDAGFGGLALFQHHFEVEEFAEAFHAVQVHACAAHDEQPALLAHAPRLAPCERERLAQHVGRGAGRDQVERFLGARAVGAAVEDQLGAVGREGAQLEAVGAVVAAEEGVVLCDLCGALVGQCFGDGCHAFDAVDAGLDLDVSCHFLCLRVLVRGACKWHPAPLALGRGVGVGRTSAASTDHDGGVPCAAK
jgi:hypothetical protein